jgi:predicted dinucleotide-binding enzyme
MFRGTLLSVLLLAASLASAETVAIIGTGNVGMALGTEFAGLGHTVIYGSRTPDAEKTLALVAKTSKASAASPAAAADAADVVVLATPGMVTERLVSGLGDLSGKIIIDVTNPLIFEGNPPVVTYGTERSLGEIVQDAHPGAFVVKAFNTISWQAMIDPPTPAPIIPLAGNNDEAKKKVAGWAREMGIDSVDVGGIYHARATEHLIVMMLNNAFTGPGGFTLEFRKLD